MKEVGPHAAQCAHFPYSGNQDFMSQSHIFSTSDYVYRPIYIQRIDNM